MCTKRLTVEARGVIFASCWCDTDLTGDNPLRCYINTSSTSVQGHRLQCTAPVIITGLSVDRSLQHCGRSVAPGHRDLHKLCVCVCVCAGIVYRHCLHSGEGSIQLTGVRPSVRPSVCRPIRPPHAAAAGLLLWARHKNHSAAGVGRTHCGTSSSIAGFVRRKEGRGRREKRR